MDDEPDLICTFKDRNGDAWVSLAEHERVRRKKAILSACIVDIAARLNQMADELSALNTTTAETQPSPLGRFLMALHPEAPDSRGFRCPRACGLPRWRPGNPGKNCTIPDLSRAGWRPDRNANTHCVRNDRAFNGTRSRRKCRT